MEFKIDEASIMDYLYGNLSSAHKKQMEEAILADDKLKKEVEELAQVMGFMGKLDDKEVIPPAFVFQSDEEDKETFLGSHAFKWVASIAAGLLILLMSAYATDLRVNSTPQGMFVSFGEKEQDTGLSQDEVKEIIHAVLTNYDQERSKQLTELEGKLSDKINESQGESIESVKTYIDQSNLANRKMIANYVETSSQQQKEYLTTAFNDFGQFYNKQRKEDLQAIQTGILDYKSANDQKLYQTDLVLADIMDIVNTQNK